MEGMGRNSQIYKFTALETHFCPTKLKTYDEMTPDIVFSNYPSSRALQRPLNNLDAFVNRLIPRWQRKSPLDLSFNLIGNKTNSILPLTR